jgi:NhaP-type Na+/H+ or K+/H+ antiporter
MFGACGAIALVLTLRVFSVEARQVARLGTLAVALGTATLSDGCARGTAITAAAIAGLICNAWMDPENRAGARTFMLDLVQVGLAIVFVLVAAGIDLGLLVRLGLPGLAVVGIVMVLIRPLVVGLCTVGAGYTVAERAFIAWMGPRGIVAAATGLAVSQELARRNVPTGELVGPLVLLTIIVTVFVQGGLSGAIATWLGLTRPASLERVVPAEQPGDGSGREAVAS